MPIDTNKTSVVVPEVIAKRIAYAIGKIGKQKGRISVSGALDALTSGSYDELKAYLYGPESVGYSESTSVSPGESYDKVLDSPAKEYTETINPDNEYFFPEEFRQTAQGLAKANKNLYLNADELHSGDKSYRFDAGNYPIKLSIDKSGNMSASASDLYDFDPEYKSRYGASRLALKFLSSLGKPYIVRQDNIPVTFLSGRYDPRIEKFYKSISRAESDDVQKPRNLNTVGEKLAERAGVSNPWGNNQYPDGGFAPRDNTRTRFVPEVGYIGDQNDIPDRSNVRLDDGPMGFMPVVGDALQAGQAVRDFNDKKYGQAALGAGMLLLPNILEKPVKAGVRALKSAVKSKLPFSFGDGLVDLTSMSDRFAAPFSHTPAPGVPAAAPYSIEKYPGYMLKSLMEGNPLEKQLSKTGTVNVNNVRALIGKGNKVEQAVVDKVLASEEFAGKKSIDYNKFRKAVQDELITYERIPDRGWEDYGVSRLGLKQREDLSHLRNIEDYARSDRFDVVSTDTIGQATLWRDKVTGDILDWDGVTQRYLSEHDVNAGPGLNTFTFSSSRIPNGSGKHYNANTLGHSRTYTTADEPDVLHVMESQSDWAQAGKEVNRKSGINSLSRDEVEGNINSLRRNIARDEAVLEEGIGRNGVPLTEAERFGIDQTLGVEKEQLESFEQWLRDIDSAPAKTFSQTAQEEYLIDNYTSRQIQENLRYAFEKGQTKMRYPTRETAAKIEGYPVSEERLLDYDRGTIEYDAVKKELYEHPEYSSEHESILKKYTNFPKQYKKLFKDADVRTVTDPKGNTWYEVDVPDDYLNQEWQYRNGGLLHQYPGGGRFFRASETTQPGTLLSAPVVSAINTINSSRAREFEPVPPAIPSYRPMVEAPHEPYMPESNPAEPIEIEGRPLENAFDMSTVVPILDFNEMKMRQRYAESGFRDNLTSKAGAKGRYQIMPITLQEYTERTGKTGDLMDATFNEGIRDWYMDTRLPQFSVMKRGNPTDLVREYRRYAAYNMGPGALNKVLTRAEKDGVDINNTTDWVSYLPKETRDYVSFIVGGQDVADSSKTRLLYEAAKRLRGVKMADGGKIHIKPSHRGRLTELKKRTGKSEAELYNDGNPAHKKMVVFARNARKWKRADGGDLNIQDGISDEMILRAIRKIRSKRIG